MSPSAAFRCFAGCDFRADLGEIVYRCPSCGGLLEVTHDLAALRATSPAEWKALFDRRWRRSAYPYGSGVWGKKEWVHPGLSDANVVSLFEGGSHLFHARRHGAELGLDELWVKQCGESHTGSFKDLGMTVLVSAVKQMRADGVPIRAVACASTGDTSAALAAYCAAAGIPSVVLLPRGQVTTAQLVQPIANGALVLELDTDFDGCMKVVEELANEKSIYLANSMNSLRVEGQKTLAIEVCQQLDWEPPDFVIVPGGNLGNSSAIAKGFLMLRDLGLISRLPRLGVAQAEAANPLWRAYSSGTALLPMTARPTLASAIRIGAPVSAAKALAALRDLDGLVEQATEDELANAAARADRGGLFCDPHTGVALAALAKLVSSGTIRRHHRVVVVSTAHGLKFTDFKIRYHEDRLAGVTPSHRNPPVAIPATLAAVQDAIAKRLGGG
jgi:threonine synthase